MFIIYAIRYLKSARFFYVVRTQMFYGLKTGDFISNILKNIINCNG